MEKWGKLLSIYAEKLLIDSFVQELRERRKSKSKNLYFPKILIQRKNIKCIKPKGKTVTEFFFPTEA